MRPPRSDASSDVHLVYTDHVEGGFEAWLDAEVLTPDQQASIIECRGLLLTVTGALRTKVQATEVAERAVSKARARFGVRDVILDLRVNTVSDGLLNGPALRSRHSAVYQTVFQGVASDITRAKIREEPDLVARMRKRLADTADFPQKAALLAEIDPALQRSLDARSALLLAETAKKEADDEETAAKIAVRHALEQIYGKLRAAFPGRREFVESFFPKRESARAAEETDEEPPADEQPAG
jgi:hypothetical protein